MLPYYPELDAILPIGAGRRQSAKMKISKVGNQTNSQDPQAVNSRVFVGNLNTFQCSKTDVERMFQRYGRLAVKGTNNSDAGKLIIQYIAKSHY
ncbi:unnamed protein product [Acanthoscelides obtectus]|uniref:RRM domain-containing protein n=1 Tax=Acanthoscelides obtectus TaxID=200917 RepID=A0A9P0LKH0_ACAOB|nr:unnamed protein product [Acanthoscelides obtectus]CAK1686238.1 RNA-binding protein Raly [Acanthoscelides obtectus]